jgi:hypothetical protein
MAVRRGMTALRRGVGRVLLVLAALWAAAGVARGADNGQLWQFKAGDIVYATATSADGTLSAVGSRDSSAYVLDASGKVLWHYTTRNVVTSVAISPEGGFVPSSFDGTGKMTRAMIRATNASAAGMNNSA